MPQQTAQGIGSRGDAGQVSSSHTCPWTCLSGMSVSPPHPCIQSPVLTGTRREECQWSLGPSNVSPTLLQGLAPSPCAVREHAGIQPLCSWPRLLSHSCHPCPCCPGAASPGTGPGKSPCTSGEMATVLAPHPASRQGGWVASDTRMRTGGTVSHCPHPVLPQADPAHGTAWGSGGASCHPDKHRAALTGVNTLTHTRDLIFTSACNLSPAIVPCTRGELPASLETIHGSRLPLPVLRELQLRSSKDTVS